MIRVRTSATRGHFRNHWLEARFSFSFGDYRDAAFDGYSDLQVLNDDRVAPGGGFKMHPHADVEVMSYPLAGTIEHRDSLGNVALMRPGDVHLMRAGTGILHSEMNASTSEPEHHLQWWIRPATKGLAPAYARIEQAASGGRDGWRLIGSADGADGSLVVAQDVRIFVARVENERMAYRPPHGRRTHLHVARGALRANGHALDAGDGAFAEDEAEITLEPVAGQTAEVLLFDLR
jgi:redox-sensitive bicupin YhaK (pirin superfamily)